MPACPHRPPCPGCPRWFEGELPARAREAYDALVKRAGIAFPVFHRGAPLGYRVRARLSVRGRAASPKVGIFQEGSHRIVDIPRCQVHHAAINEAVALAKSAIRETGIAPYAEGPHKGLVRGLQIVVERATGRVQLVVVSNSEDPTPLEPLFALLQSRGEASLHSLWWNGNPTRHNHFLGSHWRRIAGPDAIEEEIAGAHVFYPPDAFGQSHLSGSEALIHELAGQVPTGSRVAEFYAGTGAIGLGLVGDSRSVAFNEVGEGSLRGLQRGIEALPIELARRCRVLPGEADAATQLLAEADVVIVDPPRKGLDPKLRSGLCEQPPQRVLYVSCGIDSFERDAAALLASGHFVLRHLSAWDLFPHTEHVETLACFERIQAPGAGATRANEAR